jgi:dTDP-4-dehydrorhamnose reductase
VAARRVAITGATGQLGRQLVIAFRRNGDEILPLSRPAFDLAVPATVDAITAWHPDVIVNSAAWTDVDGCAREPDLARAMNGEAAGMVARAAAKVGALAVQISSNEVFAGDFDRPYGEDDPTGPINAYGCSKLLGEELVRAATPRHLVVRTAWLFGPGGTNFVTKILAGAQRAAARGEALRVVDDEWGNPTWTPALAEGIVAAVESSEIGIRHVAGLPATTRLDWADEAIAAAGIAVTLEGIPAMSFERASRPPARAVLAPSAGYETLEWRQETRRFATATVASWLHQA